MDKIEIKKMIDRLCDKYNLALDDFSVFHTYTDGIEVTFTAHLIINNPNLKPIEFSSTIYAHNFDLNIKATEPALKLMKISQKSLFNDFNSICSEISDKMAEEEELLQY